MAESLERVINSSEKDFNHPYKPYSIQQDFMQNLYSVLDNSQIGIFESPTGTGKTLSITCGAMTWLRDNALVESDKDRSEADCAEPDWILQQERERILQERAASFRLLRAKLSLVRAQEAKDLDIKSLKSASRTKRLRLMTQQDIQPTSDFLPDEISSITDVFETGRNPPTAMFSEVVLNLLRQTGHSSAAPQATAEVEHLETRRIFFCSRTHSQLTQLAAELRKLDFPAADRSYNGDAPKEAPRYVALGSRKNLCINPVVAKLPLDELNETCRSLQDKQTPSESQCKFLAKDSNDPRQTIFRDRVMADIRDIEDLVTLGKDLGICPYYSSRSAIPTSEIVSMPYSLLLNTTARDSLGLQLHGSIVIIDEAHNLADAINDLSSASLSSKQISLCEVHLEAYVHKFLKRLGGKHSMYISQLRSVLSGMGALLSDPPPDGEVSFSQILHRGSDSINVHELTAYLQVSKLARKVDSYSATIDAPISPRTYTKKTVPALAVVSRFLSCLANTTQEGRLLVHKNDEDDVALRYMLLDPADAFADIVGMARSVILAGGTMQPVSDLVTLLFPKDSARVKVFEYGHVIPKENLEALILPIGPTRSKFNFTYENRHDLDMLDDLARALKNLVGLIPGGTVVFFTSYDYMKFVIAHWRNAGHLTTLESKKQIFLENKEENLDELLTAYSRVVEARKGAILFAIIGGKLSEGINFSDNLGRAVFVIGLPFPNPNSPDWRARLDYLANRHTLMLEANGYRGPEATKLGAAAAREYYDNVTMRAINQAIGRAIRHKGDYAMIFLVDERYARTELKSKLPAWIRSSLLSDVVSYGPVIKNTAMFFRSKSF